MTIAASPAEIAADIVAAIASVTIDLSNEKATQADIAAVLTRRGLPFTREHRLGSRDIPDFLVADAVAIEVKIGGAKVGIYRQLTRYAAHPEVAAIVLVSNVPIALPSDIEGKPARLAHLGASWL